MKYRYSSTVKHPSETEQQVHTRYSFGCRLTWAPRCPNALLLGHGGSFDLGPVYIVEDRKRVRPLSVIDKAVALSHAAARASGRDVAWPNRLESRPGDVLYSWQAYFSDRSDLELTLSVMAAYGIAAQVTEIFPMGTEWHVLRSGFRRVAWHENWGGHYALGQDELERIQGAIAWCLSEALPENLARALRAFSSAYTALGEASCILGCYAILDGLTPHTPSYVSTSMSPKERGVFRQRAAAFLRTEELLSQRARDQILRIACDAHSESRLATIRRFVEIRVSRPNLGKKLEAAKDVRHKAAHGVSDGALEELASYMLGLVSEVLRIEIDRAAKLARSPVSSS